MRVFVGGATGYVGSAVVRALLARGHAVVGSARSDAAADKLRAAGAEALRADLSDPESFARASRDVDGVVQAASTADASSRETEPAVAQAVLGALAGTGKPFVLTSGVWVYGPTGARAATEDSPLNPIAMVAWRPAVERAVVGAKDVRGVVVRPGMVYGRGGGLVNLFFEQARSAKVVRLPGDGQSRWALVHVDDLGLLYALAVEGAPAGSVFNATSEESMTLADLGRAVARNVGGVPVKIWPIEQARQEIGPLADGLALDQVVRSARAEKILGWRAESISLRADIEGGSYANSYAK